MPDTQADLRTSDAPAKRPNRFLVLLLMILLLLIASPFLLPFVRFKLLLDIFYTIILLSALWAISDKRRHLIVAVVLAVPYLATTWAGYFEENYTIALADGLTNTIFFGFVAYVVLRHVFGAVAVTREVIFAAVVAYLFIALAWANVYATTELVFPGSYALPESGFEVGLYELVYFSFVTITTLGYGDITPLTDRAAGLAVVEALVGQIYMVVLVAWLVGMHVSQKSK